MERDDPFGLTGKVVVITGGANGIGAATAALFGRWGVAVALCDRVESATFKAGRTELDDGTAALCRVLDVRDVSAVDSFLSETVDRFGRVDILVNNAGGTFASPMLEVSAKGEAALIAENFTQVTNLIRRTVPVMPRGGSIINVTSIEAHRAAPGFAVYAAMKAGLANLTKTLALELAPLGIRVNAIAPDALAGTGADAVGEGFRAGPVPYRLGHRTPLGHDGTAADAAGAALYLASDLADFVTGVTIPVDGGNHAAGGWQRVDIDPSGRGD
jgi:NAD(P)-dependent dehydrogenase (short-subunit alcohol dehydrogenase family)